MTTKKIKKTDTKVGKKSAKKKTGIAAIWGLYKGKIHYTDDSIFNLGL